eukprot:241129-Pleurochrysis_carterae.AAC.1
MPPVLPSRPVALRATAACACTSTTSANSVTSARGGRGRCNVYVNLTKPSLRIIEVDVPLTSF